MVEPAAVHSASIPHTEPIAPVTIAAHSPRHCSPLRQVSQAAPVKPHAELEVPARQELPLQQPLQPSEDLAAVVGGGTMARGEVVSKVWEYIKSNKLQNPDDGREILADDKLRKVFGKDKVSMFEMNKFLSQHLK